MIKIPKWNITKIVKSNFDLNSDIQSSKLQLILYEIMINYFIAANRYMSCEREG